MKHHSLQVPLLAQGHGHAEVERQGRHVLGGAAKRKREKHFFLLLFSFCERRPAIPLPQRGKALLGPAAPTAARQHEKKEKRRNEKSKKEQKERDVLGLVEAPAGAEKGHPVFDRFCVSGKIDRRRLSPMKRVATRPNYFVSAKFTDATLVAALTRCQTRLREAGVKVRPW